MANEQERSTAPESAKSKEETAPAAGLDKAVKSLPENLSQRKPAPYSVNYSATYRPKSAWEELKEQASMAFGSGLLPRSIDTREKALTIAMMGKELGITPMQALCGIYVVNGMTALRGSLMLRLIYERVPGARISVLTPPERANEECVVEMQRPHGKPQIFRFTLEDAKRAGFLNKPIWQQHTSTMLRWAAIRTGARIVFADAIAGCYMEDEIPAVAVHSPQVENPELVPAEVAVNSERPAPEPPVPTQATAESTDEQAQAPSPLQETVAENSAYFAHPRETVSSLLSKPVTEKQVNRLYAIAHDRSWTRQEVAMWMEKWFKKRDPRELNRAEYDRICNFLLGNTSATAKKKSMTQ